MLKQVFFLISADSGRGGTGAAAEEAGRAVRALEAEGIESGIIREQDIRQFAEAESGDRSPEHTLFLCDTEEGLRSLQKMGFYAVGYAHAENASEHFPGASYIIQEPDLVDIDSYVKIYEREAGLPWTILRTPRCLVREFTTDDLDGIYALYDGQARQYLEPPSADRAWEREVLEAYIERIYGLYGFGHWAVLALDPVRDPKQEPAQNPARNPIRKLAGEPAAEPAQNPAQNPVRKLAGEPAGKSSGKPADGLWGLSEAAADVRGPQPAGQDTISPLPVEPGTLIGRIGFTAVTSEREAQMSALGVGGIDADFGFLVAASCRGTGAAEEVCAAILRYGFEELGFSRVSADADPHNRASIRLLKKLGFEEAGKTGGKILFALSGHAVR